MPAPDPIAELVGRLELTIVAPRRQREALAREVEGDLREDLAARVADGQAPRAAAAAIVAEFGEVRAIARELSAELLAAGGKRLAALGAVGVATLLLAWIGGMTTLVDLGLRVPPEGGWMLQVSRSLDLAGPLVAGVAIVGAVAIRRSGAGAAIATVAALQLGFASVLVAGTIAMLGTVAVPAAGAGVLAGLVGLTLLLGSALAAASAAMLVRCGAVRRAPRRARS